MAVSFSNQLTPNNQPTNKRAILDTNFIVAVALPNAANVVNTNAIDLQQAVPYPTTEEINVQVIIGASNGANSKNINAVIQQTTANTDGTANAAAWTNVAYLANPLMVNADNAGGGHPESNVVVKLAPSNQRFIRAQATGEANGGNANNGNLTLQLLF